MTGEAPGQPVPNRELVIRTARTPLVPGIDRTPPAPAGTLAATGPRGSRGHRSRLPDPAGLAGIRAEAIRSARPADMIAAPRWR
jgi:hypothetical protein